MKHKFTFLCLVSLCIYGHFSLLLGNSVEAVVEATPAKPAIFKCYDFNQNLSPEESKTNKNLLDFAILSGKADQIAKYKKMTSTYTADIKALQAVLEKEGFVVSASEKLQTQIGVTTIKALASFQEKYKDKIVGVSMSPKGKTVTTPASAKTGLVDSATRSVLNQKYACSTNLITLSLILPNADTSGHVGSVMPIKWTASSTLSTFTKVRIVLVDLISNKQTTIKEVSSTLQSFDYTVPSSGAQGTVVGLGSYSDARYRIDLMALDVSDAVLQTVQSKPFSIGKKVPFFTVTSPAKGEQVELGSPLKVLWTAQNIQNASVWVRIDLLRKDGSLAQTLSTNKVMLSAKLAPITLSNLIEVGTYMIRITSVLVDGTELQSTTGEFSISNKQPRVTVVTPNTAAEYKINKAISISWSSKNLPDTVSSFDIYLVDTVATTSVKIASAPRVAVSTPWIAPQNGILGYGKDQVFGIGDTKVRKYKIEIRVINQSGLTVASDQSDANFAISQ